MWEIPAFLCLLGAGKRVRTVDPDLGKVVLYQLSYSRLFFLQTPLYLDI